MTIPARTDARTALIRWGSFYGDSDFELTFPAGWDVNVHEPAGGDDIGDEGIAAAFDNPIGSAPIRELARGKRSACIVVDDLTRPTPAARLAPRVIEELVAAGIEESAILILGGVANHRQMTREDFVRKVGEDIASRFELRSHFSWGQLRVRWRDQPRHARQPQQRVPRRGSAHPHRQHPAAQQDRLLRRGQAGPARRRAHRHGRRLARSGGPDDRPGADRQRVAPRRRGGGAAGGRGLHRQRDPQHPPRDRRPRRRRPRRGAPRRRGDRAPHLRDQAADRRRRVRALRVSEGRRVPANRPRLPPDPDRGRADRPPRRHDRPRRLHRRGRGPSTRSTGAGWRSTAAAPGAASRASRTSSTSCPACTATDSHPALANASCSRTSGARPSAGCATSTADSASVAVFPAATIQLAEEVCV